MADLSIITLNVNGLRAQRKRLLLFDFLKRSKFDIVLLQETHVSSVSDCVLWNRESGFKGYWSLGTSSSCGVGILVRDPSRLKNCSFRCDDEGRIIMLDCSYCNQDFRIISIYVPTDGSQRIDYFQKLDRYLVTRRRLIIGGDFNCLLDLAKDKRGGNANLGGTGGPHLKQVLTRFSLVDIWRQQHEHALEFTWRNKTGTICCRLDKFYVSSSLATDYVTESNIITYPYSDHDIVHLKIQVVSSSHNVGPGLWKLNTSLLDNKSVRDKVQRFWTDWKTKKALFSNVGEWWDAGKARIKSLLIACSKKIAMKNKQTRASLLNKYRRLIAQGSLSDSEIKELDAVKIELSNFDFRRVRGHNIRCKAQWIENNERPSKFFFQRERKRAVKKTCPALRTCDGRRLTDQADIMREQVRFYTQLYSRVATDRTAQDRLLGLLDRKLSNEQRNLCEGLFFEGECLAALKTMSNGKTPGSDGLSKEFYITFWPVLKDDFVDMVNTCFTDGMMPETLRQAVISLLYKKDDPELLKNWRPISLLNVDYKIMTKVLVNRLKPHMSTIVHPDQCCSVPGRSSDDNATLLRDICDYLEVHERMACAFISIDQEKAFDYVDWEFLDRILQTLNFGPNFRSMITCIYTNIQSAILSNGYVSEFFAVERGVRQGCPLSPLLFVLVAEVFAQAIRKCPEIQGFRVPGGREVKISQYADDNTCIVTNSYGLVKVLEVFNEYGRASGARLNVSKTKGLWLGRWKSRTDSPCGLVWLNTSLKIVGLYFGNEDASTKTWNETCGKFSGVIEKWRPRFLTLRGKATVLESLAVSTIWHVAKIYPPCRDVIDSLQSSIWKFLWSGKPELVRRETCMSNFVNGGLRIVHVALRVKALLIGRLFRFLDDSDGSWKEMMRYYVARALGINDNTRPNCDIPSPFYSCFLRVLREFSVDSSKPQPSKVYYMARVKECITPIQAHCELRWNEQFGPGVNWKEVWKDVSQSWNDPLLRDFDWRTVHRILPVNSRLHRWNHHMPECCARCGARSETLDHVLVHCPKIHCLWMYILRLCGRIDPSVHGFSEKNILLGCFPHGAARDLLRYLISVGKFSAWKERVSYQYKKDQKISSVDFFKNYVRVRLEAEQTLLTIDDFTSKWAVNNVLACVKNEHIYILL